LRLLHLQASILSWSDEFDLNGEISAVKK
jgi:hypothetical protein